MGINPTPNFGTATPLALRTDYVVDDPAVVTPDPPGSAYITHMPGALDATNAEVKAIALWAGNGQQSFAAMALAAVQTSLNAKANASDVATALALKLDASQKGANNGVASLDSTGKVPSSQLPAASGVTYTQTEKDKLAGIAPNATANSSDAVLENRANHTGTQSADTIVDGTANKVLTSALRDALTKGALNVAVPSDLRTVNQVSSQADFWKDVSVVGLQVGAAGPITNAPTQGNPVTATNNPYYTPIRAVVDWRATDPLSPYQAASWGVESQASIGRGGVAAAGTIQAFTARVNAFGGATDQNELAAYFGEVTVADGVAARTWFGDFTARSGKTSRQSLLNGITMVVNNGGTQDPTAGPSGCFWAVGGDWTLGAGGESGNGFAGGQAAIPTNVGVGVVGRFGIGLQVGGWGSGWTSSSYVSQIGTGVVIRQTSVAAMTIDVMATPTAGQVLWGGDTNLYRSAADTLATDDDLRIANVAKGIVLTDTMTGAVVRAQIANGAWVFTTLAAGSAYLADSFSRGPATSLGTTETGSKPWQVSGGTAAITSGNKVRFTGTNSSTRATAMADSSHTDVDVAVTLIRADAYPRVYARGGAGGPTGSCVFATSDGGQALVIYQTDGTNNTNLAQGIVPGAPGNTWAVGDAHRLELRAKGNQVALLFDGIVVIPYTTVSGLPTGTYCGFGDDGAASGNNVWDDFNASAAP